MKSFQLPLAVGLLGSIISFGNIGCGPSPGATVNGRAMFTGHDQHGGINVEIVDTEFTALTDDYGYFSFADVPNGNYHLQASHAATREGAVAVKFEHDGVDPSQLFLTLTPQGRIEGRVLDEDDEGFAGAGISVIGGSASSVSFEEGRFSISQSPVGDIHLLVTAAGRLSTITPIRLEPGDQQEVVLRIGARGRDDIYEGNQAPQIGEISIEAAFESGFPRAIAIGSPQNTNKVRRGARYELSVTAQDPDGDPIQVFWSVDRGSLDTPITDGEGLSTVDWRAGAGSSTLTASVVDSFGATTSTVLNLQSAGASLRGGAHYDGKIYFAERRSESFDLFTFNLADNSEMQLVSDLDREQHAPLINNGHLVFGDTEFVFVGTLAYRATVHALETGDAFSFGQSFGHDDFFVMQLDLYTPSASKWLPFRSQDPTLAPVGFGYLNLETGDTVSPFVAAPTPPQNAQAFARSDGRDLWLGGDAQVWTQSGGEPPVIIEDLSAELFAPQDVQLHGTYGAYQTRFGGRVSIVDFSVSNTPVSTPLGDHVTSFALHGDYLAVIEQTEVTAVVEVHHLPTGTVNTLPTEPHFRRRIWSMDDTYLIWGDQGVEGDASPGLNAERLWVAPYK